HQFLAPLGGHPGTRQGHRHSRQNQHDREGHDQLDQRQSAFVSPFPLHTSSYLTLTTSCGLPEATTCPDELFTARLLTLTVVEPFALVRNVRVTRTPEPFTPGAPGMRLSWMLATPASFCTFL